MAEEENDKEKKEPEKKKFEFVCPICGKEFDLRLAFLGHMRSHEKNK